MIGLQLRRRSGFKAETREAASVRHANQRSSTLSQPGEVSCRVTDAVLKYLEASGYDTASILAQFPCERCYLTDASNWVPSGVRDSLCDLAVAATGNPMFMYEVGCSLPRLRSIGGVERLILFAANPRTAYASLGRFARYFDRLFVFQVEMTGPTSARVSMTPMTDYAWSKHACYFVQGILATMPTAWGLPEAQVRETRCYGDAISPNTGESDATPPACEFLVDWAPSPPATGNTAEMDEATRVSISRLEADLELLDSKNADLAQREMQVSKVREIALALDAAGNVSDVFQTAATLARDIPGVRFVMAHALDASGQHVTTPYFSPIRDTKLIATLAAAGIDLPAMLGKEPSGQRLSFPIAKSKFVQDYLAAPRVIVKERLSDVLAGVWPKAVCSTIQKAVGVHRFVLVPITAGGENAGSLFFLLQKEVPIDILEMTAAHCAAAIKNAQALEVLENRNRELWIANEIVRQTSSSLDPHKVLDSAAKAIKHLLRAEAVGIHIGRRNEPYVGLVAEDGMPADWADALQYVPREVCDRELESVSALAFVNKYPRFKALPQVPAGTHFTFVRLPFKGDRVGRLTIMRSGSPLDESGESILRSVAAHVTLAAENAYLHAEIVAHAEAQRLTAERARASEALLATSERKYRLITENASDYISGINLKGEYHYVSPSHRNLGLDPSDMIGKSAFDFVHPDDRLRLLPKLAKYEAMALAQLGRMRMRAITEEVSFRFRDAAGEWHDIEATAGMDEGPDGKGCNILLACRDMTERNRAAQALQRARDELEVRVQERTAQLSQTNDELQTEIRERQTVEEQLRASEERFRVLFQYAPDAYFLRDFKGNVVDGNAATELLLGYSREEIVGRSIAALGIVCPDHMANAAKMFSRTAVGRPSGPDPLTLRRKDGRTVDVEVSSYPVKLNGRALILGIARDISEHKRIELTLREAKDTLEQRVQERTTELTNANRELQAEIAARRQREAELVQSQERYKTIFDSANDILLLIGKNGKILEVNHRISEIGGYKQEDLIGHHIGQLTKMMPRSSIATVLRNFAKRLAGTESPPYQVEMYRQNGENALIEINATAVRQNGRVVGTLAVLRDITSREQNVVRLQEQNELIDRILSTMPSAVAVLNWRKEIVLANQAMSDSLSVPRDEMLGKHIRTFLDVRELEKAIDRVLKGSCEDGGVEFRLQADSGDRVFLSHLIGMSEDEILLVLDDVTDERKRQERLYLTDRLASVGEMASGIAHELNNPLTSVIGLSELLTEESLPEEIREDVTAINQEAQRAATIVRNLLTFARRHAPTRDDVQVNDVIKDVLRLRAYEERAHNIQVALSLDAELPKVEADPFQMQQVLLNVILNAEHAVAHEHDRGTIFITTERDESNIRISIVDDGPGISPKNLPHLFDPFFTTKEVGKGTGLGLSICYGIIAEHGGSIAAQNEPDGGARFTIELPL